MKLIVGLGNPGAKYSLTRHNVGFVCADHLADRHAFGPPRIEQKSELRKGSIRGEPVLVAKPQTFMNLSGESVRPLMDYYKIELKDLLVIQDEIEIPFGSLRFHIRRGAGGHNGIKSLHQHLGSDDYARLKLGVGRPSHPGHDIADYVLSSFIPEEISKMPDFMSLAVDAAECFIFQGLERAANTFNRKQENL